MRRRAAKLGNDAGNLRQDLTERRSSHFGHEHVARRNAAEFAFAIDDSGSPASPADPGRMTVNGGMLQPDLVRNMGWLDMEGTGLQQLEAVVVERPFDFDRPSDHAFRLSEHATKRYRLTGFETRRADERFRHSLRRRALAVHASLTMPLASGFDFA